MARTLRSAAPLIASAVLLLATAWPLRAQSSARDERASLSVAERERLAGSIADFLMRWRAAWQASESATHAIDATPGTAPRYHGIVRIQRMHCHGDEPHLALELVSVSRLRICPGYPPPGEEPAPGDERIGMDRALVASARDEVRAARAALLARLDSAATTAPADAWLAGQRVRFHVEQEDSTAALAAAIACGSASWCDLLAGFTHAHFGHLGSAEAAFHAALAAMPEAERCRWEDLSELLDDWQAREAWRSRSCARRLADAERFWWLADPLFTEPGNERWVEQQVRRVLVALHAAVPQDARWHWDARYGGDVVRTMVLRYGWPGHFYWGGTFQDDDHRKWTQLPKQAWRIAPNATFWAPVYSPDRLHLAPTTRQWRAPFDSSAWRTSGISAPRPDDDQWWPQEHFAPARPLADLADAQVGLLRRQDSVLLVIATDPARTTTRTLLTTGAASVRSALVWTTGPDDVRVLAPRVQPADARVVMAAPLSPGAQGLIAVELDPIAEGIAADAPRRRFRVGMQVPASLAAMRARDLAVATPILLGSPAFEGDLPDDTTVLGRLMLPGTQLGMRPVVALYWETYGLRAQDTVAVTLRVTRVREGTLARIGGALDIPGFGAQGQDAAALTWTETPRATTTSAATGTPIRSWTRRLDISHLPTGRYRVEVLVQGPDGRATSAPRTFSVSRDGGESAER